MKTLHLTNSWHASSGGIGTFYKALFETANRVGHLIRLVVPSHQDLIEDVGEFGRIYHLRAPRAPLNPDYRILYPNRFLFPQSALQRILNAELPDLIEVSEKYTSPYLAGLLRTRRLPGVRFRPTTVGTSHERMDENMRAYLSQRPVADTFCNWYMKSIYFPMFDHHIAVSDHTSEELIAASRGHKVRRGIWVSPMGVDSESFHPSRRNALVRARLSQLVGGHDGANILFYAGRLAPEKNLPLLLETARLLDPARFRFLIAGDGIMLPALRKQCQKEGLHHVHFTGHLADRGLLADFYANADIFVHPNPREPFGIAPLEAMASGTALVAPNAGGVTSYANTGNAWLAAPRAEDFAKMIHAALADNAERSQRAARGRQTAESHAWQLVARGYLEVLREIHDLTQHPDQTPHVSARTWSTPGDWFGRELIEL